MDGWGGNSNESPLDRPGRVRPEPPEIPTAPWQEETGKNSGVRTFSNDLVEFLKTNEGLRLTAYNNGKTIGYGFDFYLYPDVKINYTEDGTSISPDEAERLLRIMLKATQTQITDFLENHNLEVNQNTFDALTDLFYNRNSNPLTREIAFAMAERDDEKVLSLFSDFDYRYALTYLYPNDRKKAQAYVDRNPGLKIRREKEYHIYKNGFR